jgi:hypothetical protein
MASRAPRGRWKVSENGESFVQRLILLCDTKHAAALGCGAKNAGRRTPHPDSARWIIPSFPDIPVVTDTPAPMIILVKTVSSGDRNPLVH